MGWYGEWAVVRLTPKSNPLVLGTHLPQLSSPGAQHKHVSVIVRFESVPLGAVGTGMVIWEVVGSENISTMSLVWALYARVVLGLDHGGEGPGEKGCIGR